MKMVLKCEQYNYHDLTGRKAGVDTTITHEIEEAAELSKVLEGVEMFLRGCGFHFDGVLDIVPHDVIMEVKKDEKPLPHFPV